MVSIMFLFSVVSRYKTFFSMKFFMLINVETSTIPVGIITLISRINTAFDNFKSRDIGFCEHFNFL